MLILPIKKKWYDMILSGEKTEEYRDIKPYYETRFRNGYSKNSPAVIVDCTLSIKTGNPEWGAEPGKKYFVLKIQQFLIEGRELKDE